MSWTASVIPCWPPPLAETIELALGVRARRCALGRSPRSAGKLGLELGHALLRWLVVDEVRGFDPALVAVVSPDAGVVRVRSMTSRAAPLTRFSNGLSLVSAAWCMPRRRLSVT